MDLSRKDRGSLWDDAARWYARMRGPDCTGRDREEFEDWLKASPTHWRAYAEAERVARRFDQLLELDPELQQMTAEAAAGMEGPHSKHNPDRKRWSVPVALAASAVLALLTLRVVGNFDPYFDLGAPSAAVVYSAYREQLDVELTDRSVMRLDVGSEVSVEMSDGLRQVTLRSGRAIFDVAKDPSRPFIVSAGTTRTTALGTRFQVQSDPGQVVVTLTEGSVAVSRATASSAWEERLVPGQQLSVAGEESTPVKREIDPLMVTSWSRGRLIFRGTPLSQVLDEVNRYSVRKLRLADASLAELPVGGNFIAGNSELIVSALAAALPLRAVDGGDEEILLFRRYESDSP